MLKDELRKVIYTMVSRGMFERHKLVFLTQLTIRLMAKGKFAPKEEYDLRKVLFLLTGGIGEEKSQVSWLDDKSWNMIVKLSDINGFERLPEDISKAWTAKFKDYYNDIAPEKSKLPADYFKFDNKFEQILIIRALRPDRITSILPIWINHHLGPGFIDCDSSILQQEIVRNSFVDCDYKKPMMFVNAPGVNPNSIVSNMLPDGTDFEAIPMGENKEKEAVAKIEESKTSGAWVMLENLHLMVDWMKDLTKILEDLSSSGGFINTKFRLFITTDPTDAIPIGIMERSVLIIIEAPSGIKPNMKKAWASVFTEKFNDKDAKEKNILFALC